MTKERGILILDFGAQYTQLIGRLIRSLGFYCTIHPYSVAEEVILALAPAGVVLSGGPESVTNANAPRIPEMIFTLACPILGICYGMQALAWQLGGQVVSQSQREFGPALLMLEAPSRLFANLLESEKNALAVWMSHGDHVSVMPPEFQLIASTNNCRIAAIAHEKRQYFGVQFHPEVTQTKIGRQLFEQFVGTICACLPDWTPANIIDEQIQCLKKTVGQERVLLGLSGGVDSSVAAVLLNRAIGEQLLCVFIDTGLLRLNEALEVKKLFADHFGITLHCVDAKEQFLSALADVTDPEVKRKIIGKTFVDVFAQTVTQHGAIEWLAQGTIYSDVIESAVSGSSGAQTIKSHHNVGGLPKHLPFKLLEPLRALFEDEVRKIGAALGLPYEWVNRHPFPGVGLGVRILGAIVPEYISKLQLADAILLEELKLADCYYQTAQAFAVFLPVKSVGVLGDARHYDHVIALRVVESNDYMTATWAPLPYALLDRISTRIINEVPGISRVTYDISNKPPATIEWE